MVFLFGRDGLKTRIKPPVHGGWTVSPCPKFGAAAAIRKEAVQSQFLPSTGACRWWQPVPAAVTKRNGSPGLGSREPMGLLQQKGARCVSLA